MSVSDKTRQLGAERLRLEEELDKVRHELAWAIRKDAACGARQVELVKASGYTREMIRRIVASAS